MLRRTRAIIVLLSAFLMLLCQARSVSAQAPTALFDVNDSIVCVGNVVSLTDNSIPGGAAITNWSWDFGDLSTSTLQNPTHSYSVGGNYLVTLIVTDALNNKDTITHTIYVLLAKAIQNTVRICSPQNSTSIFAVDPNIAGVTGTWFTASSAVIASPNNDTTVVSNLVSGTYLFFWVVSDGTCSDADQVTITVDQPVTTNAGPDQNICSSTGTATMAATNPSPGTGLWTTSSTATIANPPSRTSTITGLTTPGTYVFVWTTTNGSCVARDTMQIVVSSPIAANAGIDQNVCNSNPISTLAGNNPSPGTGLWTTTGTSVITTPSSASSGVTGLANGVNTFIWTITNGTCITKDTMLITVSILKVSAAGNDIQVCTSTGTGTLNGNNPSPGTGAWTALNGGTITSPTSSTTTVTGLSVVGFYNFVWTITNGACISRDTITIIVKSPVIANAGIDQSFCNVTTTTLIGNNPSPGTAAWTTTSTATITSPASATTTISNLPIGNSTFIYSTSFGACISRDTIIVHVDSLIIANAGPDQQVCQSNPNVTLAGNNPSPATGVWTKINGGTITTASSFNTTVTGIPAGTNLFVWTVTNGSCVSRDTVKITVNVQIPATAGLDDEICQGSVTSLSANNPSPATGLWTTTSIATIATPTSPSSAVSGFLNSGIYSFIWTVTNGACVLSDTVRITVDSSIVANAGTDKVLCNLSTTTVSANNPSPGIGQWTSLGSATIANANIASTTVSNLIIGNNLFVWTITNSICVSSDTINIRRDTLITSNAGVDQQVCVGSPATITGNNPTPGTGLWTALSGGVITSPSSATTTITGLSIAGTYNFVWTITNGTCTSKDTVAVVVNQNVIATAGADQLLCNVTTATLAGNNPSPGVGVWTTTSSAIITLASNPLTTVTGLTTGTYNFIWTITNGSCISKDTVQIKVDALVTSNAGVDQQVCVGSPATITGNNPTPGTGLWTALSGGIITSPSSATTTITGLSVAGTYNFIWTITNGTCTSKDTVAVVVNQNVIAAAGADQLLCNVTTATLAGNNPSPGVGVWTTTSSAVITLASNPSTTVTGLTVGTYNFIWTITNGSCISKDTIQIKVDALVTSNAGVDQQVCVGSPATITGNNPTPGTGLWTALSGGVITSPSSATTTITGLSIAGTYNFVWTITNGTCTSKDTVAVVVNQNVIATAGADQFLCNVTTATLAGNNPSPGIGAWTTSSSAIITLASNPLTTVTGLTTGTYNFIWTITNGSCISKDTVQIKVDALVTSNAGVDQQVCVGSPATITGNNPTPGTGLWTALSGGVITSPSSATTTITGLSVAGTYNFIWTITNGTCTSKDTVAVVVDSSIVANAGIDQSLCEFFVATLQGNLPTLGSGIWTTTGTANVNSPAAPNTVVSNLAYGINQFIWTITNGLCISSDTVAINVDSVIVANAGTDKSICSNIATSTLNGNNPLPANGIWTTNSAAIISNPTSFSTSVNGLINAGNYSFVWTITNGVCSSSDTVTIAVDSNVVANAGPDQQLCETQTTTTMSANVVTVGVGVWSTTSGAGITDVLDPLTSITGLTIGTHQFVWTVTNNNCETTDTINIIVAAQVTVANAGIDDEYCASVNGITIKGNDPLIGIGTWTSLGLAIVDTASASLTTISNLSIGQNLFVWTISNGGCSSSDTVSITTNPNPIVNAGLDQFTTSGTPVNIGGSPTASSGTFPYSYVWSPGVNLNDSLVSNPIATVLITQIFNISVTDSLGCIGTDTAVVYVNNPPSAINDTIITNEDSVTVIVALANDTDPDNNINPGSVQVLNGPFHGVAVVNVITGAITYTPALNYFGLDSINYAICDSGIPIYCDTAWIYINVLPINDAPIAVDDTISTPEDSCIQIGVLLNDFDVENGIQLSSLAILSGPNHGTITIDTLTGIITYCPDSNFTSIDTLTYVICDNGSPIYCDTALVIITIIPRNDAPIAMNDTTTLCSVDSVVYDVLFNDIDPEGDSLFVTILSGPFHGTAVVTSAQQIGYGSTAFYNGVDSILYQVCDNGIPSRCDTATIYIIVHATPQVSSSIINNRCFNDSLGAIDITVVGNSPFNILWSNSQTTQDIDSLPSGIYTLYLIDSFGCSVTVDDTVKGPLTALSALLSLQPVLCHGDSTGAIDLQPQGGTIPYTFVWSNADTTEDISGLLAGIYSVMISDSNGCKLSLTDSILQPDSSLAASLVVSNIKCAGDSTGAIALTVLGGIPTYTYLWSNSSSNQNISNALSGIYTVTVTDLFSCSVTISDTIKSLNSAIVANLSVVNPYCLGAVLGSISSNPTGGNSPYSFIWSTSDTLNVIDSLSAGNYFLQITDSVGCLQNDTIALSDTSSITITNSGGATICSGNSTTLSVIASPNISYSWSLNGSNLPNDTLNHLTVTQAGNYSVQATSLCGIYNAGPLSINVNALPIVTVSPGSTITCDSIITINASGGSNYSWTPVNLCNTPNSASTNVNPQTSTIFIVTVSDNIGCSTIDSVIVNVTCDTVFVPTGFSPNGDGVNDYFVISNLNRYPDAVLKIFNRWGDIVYEKDHYDNSWDGFSNGDRIRISKELPNGTYYFIFEPGNNESTKAGYVILRR